MIENQKPISREKLILFLKQGKIDTATVDSPLRYLYATGRNSFADILLASIYMGDFDED